MAPEEGPSRLRVSLTLRDGDSPQARIQGVLDVAADDLGRVRSLDEDDLRIWGVSLKPEVRQRDHLDRYLYEATWRATPEDLARLEVSLEGPRVQGRGPGVELRVPLIWRAGPQGVTLGAGEDLRLPVRGGASSPVASHLPGLDVRWWLRAGEAEAGSPAAHVSLEGEGLPPDTLRLAAARLAELGGRPLHVTLSVSVARQKHLGDAGYATELFLATELVWHVVPEAPVGVGASGP